ncbi:PREDICTED: uncharacterized protein LOC106814392 [Priapulus caudatus]|uniref:Uncharacterized protein LOC106814392 n=1 Tax=Priapulus caudatus TaxID=37621 RepID=A0ABM1EPS1_PRICU|nr:PREDICTED: uncharacterized protein LOC106814392 [Priapulus caudatus]
MSAYEDYETVSRCYDKFRHPIGAETELSALCALGKPLQELHIADIGCGTGNYTKYFLDNGVGKVSIFDASEGMLNCARVKVADYIAGGRVPHCQLLQLPNSIPGSAQYDAIFMNYVLHHFGCPEDNTATETFPKATAALRNVYEALRKGGYFIMSTSLRPQRDHCVWYHALIDDLDDLFKDPIMDLAFGGEYNTVERALTAIGFSSMKAIVPLHEIVMKPEHYYNMDAAFDPEFLLSDSTFTLVRQRDKETGDNGIKTFHQRVRALKERNEADAFMEKREVLRKTYGCATVIIAQKP